MEKPKTKNTLPSKLSFRSIPPYTVETFLPHDKQTHHVSHEQTEPSSDTLRTQTAVKRGLFQSVGTASPLRGLSTQLITSHVPEKRTQGILLLHDQNAAENIRFPNHKLGVNRNRIEFQDCNKKCLPETNNKHDLK